jgi:hypothetical protein
VTNGGDRSRWRSSDAIAAVLLSGLLGWFWWGRIIATTQQFTFSSWDLFVYFEPMYTAIGEALRHGRVPLWNPHQGCGEPLLAVLQGGVFHPARLLLLALDPAQAMGWSAYLHLGVGAISMLALVRALGVSIWAASVASIVFTYGFSASGIYQPATYLEPGMWLPVAAFAVIRTISSRRWGYVALASVSIAAPIIAGGYQIAVYAMYGLMAVYLGLWCDPNTRTAARAPGSMIRLLVAGSLAIALSSVQWAPTLFWAADSMRSPKPLSLLRVDPYHTPPMAVIEGLLGRRVTINGMFFPASLLPLAVIGALFGCRLIWPIVALALLSLCLSLGPTTPWFSLYYYLPGLSMFRAPVRLHYLVVFGAAVAAGFGLDVLRRWSRPRPILQSVIVGGVLAAAVAAVLLTPISGIRGSSGPRVDRYDWLAAGAILATAFMSPPLVGPTIAGVAASVMIGARRNESSLPYSSDTTSLLNRYRVTYSALAKRAALWRTLFITPGLFALSPAFAKKQAMRTGLYAPDDYEPLVQGRMMNYLSVLAYGYPMSESEPGAGNVKMEQPLVVPTLLDMASVRFIVVAGAHMNHDVVTMLERYRPVQNVVAPVDRKDMQVLENPSALPRAYIVTAIKQAHDDNEALTLIKDPQFDATREVVAFDTDPRLAASGSVSPAGTALITSYEPERVIIATRSERGGALVLTDAYAPGWKASIDGESVRVWQANYLFRGVTLPAGEHEVMFTYVAPGYRFGAAAAVFAIVVLAGTPVVSGLARRRCGFEKRSGAAQF